MTHSEFLLFPSGSVSTQPKRMTTPEEPHQNVSLGASSKWTEPGEGGQDRERGTDVERIKAETKNVFS